jgi:recombination protein RecA
MKSTSKEIFESLLNDKKVKATRGDDVSFEYGKIPFNIPQLDKITNGGIPRKRFTLLFGGFSSGKSYIAAQLCKSVQQNGGVPVWVDLEKSWDSKWMENCGLNTSEMILYNPDTSEEAFKAIRNSLQTGADIVVIDSVAGLVPSDIFTNEQGIGYSPIGWQSRTWNQMLMRLIPELKHGGALVAVNQTRGTMGNVQLMDTMPGGEGQKYFTHCCMHFTRGSWILKQGANKPAKMSDRIGFEINVRLLKDKFGGEKFEEAIVPFKHKGGIDIVETYIRMALEENLIKQSGAWYYYKDGKFQGIAKVVDWFKENPDVYKELVNDTEKSYITGKSDS